MFDLLFIKHFPSHVFLFNLSNFCKYFTFSDKSLKKKKKRNTCPLQNGRFKKIFSENLAQNIIQKWRGSQNFWKSPGHMFMTEIWPTMLIYLTLEWLCSHRISQTLDVLIMYIISIKCDFYCASYSNLYRSYWPED